MSAESLDIFPDDWKHGPRAIYPGLCFGVNHPIVPRESAPGGVVSRVMRASISFSTSMGRRRIHQVRLLSTSAEFTRGMRGRARAVPMLFVFRERRMHPFTMTGVRMPLDLVFLDRGRVLGVLSVPAGAPGPYRLRAPYTAVLELPIGTANRLGIRRGDRWRIGFR